jgi:hypothetical protein
VRLGSAVFSAAVFAIALADPSLAVGPGGVRLQPHVAVYDLALHRTADRLGLVAVNGRLAIEVSGS